MINIAAIHGTVCQENCTKKNKVGCGGKGCGITKRGGLTLI